MDRGGVLKTGFERERVRDAIRSELFGRERTPLRLGRFEVRERLGGGASGVVYRAYDPHLDREVALKLLSTPLARPERVRHRLREEGRALARLSHPNVVAVHEVSEHGGETFLAMELVRGSDLRRWLAEGARTEEEILAVFRQAGAGLVAAHRAGLVHRDFKPDNVLLGDDGVARVADFGLASTDEDGAGGDLRATGPAGTPAYMAPEQWLGRTVDARTDQLAFCAALWEAIYGEPPFGAGDVETIRARAIAGHVGSTESRRISSRVARALARGLAPQPGDRYPSMDELLRELAPRDRPAKKIFAAGAVLAAIAAVAVPLAQSAAPSCEDSPERLHGVWDGERRSVVRDAFMRTTLPFAEPALDLVSARLDRYANAWALAWRDTCELVHERRELSEAAAAPRRHCLELRLETLRAGTGLLAGADDRLVARAHEVVESLPPISDCIVAAGAPDPALRERLLQLEPELARVEASLIIGGGEGAQAAGDTLAKARSIGHTPSIVRAQIALGRSLHLRGDYAGAHDKLFEAITAAQSDGERLLRSRAAIELARTLGFEGSGRYEESLRWLDFAAGAAGMNEPPLHEADRLEVRAATLRRLDRFDEALRAAARSAELVANAGAGDRLRAAKAFTQLGAMHTLVDDYVTGCAQIRSGYETRLELLGPEHPELIDSYERMAGCERSFDRLDDAAQYHQRAVALGRRFLAREHKALALSLYTFSWNEVLRGRFEEAEALLVEARAGFAESADQDMEGGATAALGEIMYRRHRPAEALVFYAEAGKITDRSLPPAHVSRALALIREGRALRSLRRRDEALSRHERALAMFGELSGASYQSYTALAHMEIGLVQLDRGRPADALAALEKALEVIEHDNDWGKLLPPIRFHLARALVAAGGDRGRAFALARQAREEYIARGAHTAPMIAEVDAWLARPSLTARASPVGHANGLAQWGPFW